MFQPGNLADLISKPVGAKTDPFSLDALIAWLEKQPGNTTYDYCDSSQCLLGQYVLANGGEVDYQADEYRLHGASLCLSAVSGGNFFLDSVIMGFPETFGAALDRARALSPIKTEG